MVVEVHGCLFFSNIICHTYMFMHGIFNNKKVIFLKKKEYWLKALGTQVPVSATLLTGVYLGKYLSLSFLIYKDRIWNRQSWRSPTNQVLGCCEIFSLFNLAVTISKDRRIRFLLGKIHHILTIIDKPNEFEGLPVVHHIWTCLIYSYLTQYFHIGP